MATILDSKITVKQEIRPCMVRMADGSEKKAVWHMFTTRAVYRVRDAILQGQTGGKIGFSSPVAIVEYKDGSIHEVGATEIRFIDSDYEFSQYMWENEC